jgi:hypothetical protein
MSKTEPEPLDSWRASFGAEYIERNNASENTFRQIARAYDRILITAGIKREIGSVLEIGANIGLKLTGLGRIFASTVRLSALEQNPEACAHLRKATELALTDVFEANAYRIPAAAANFDLVFTNAVLIHIPPERLATVMRESAGCLASICCAPSISPDPDRGALARRNGPVVETRLWQGLSGSVS